MEVSEKSNTGLKVGLGILAVLLLGTIFYTYSLYNENKKTEQALISEKEQVMADLSNMAQQYDVAIKENEVVNNDLVNARERIKILIDSLKVSQNTVSSLWGYQRKYAKLQEEMKVLMVENDRLKSENELLGSSLDIVKNQLEERETFTDSLLVQNSELATAVEDASALQVVGLRGLGIIERRSGKQIPTERASRSDKLKMCFTVAKNPLTTAGDKAFYVQIIDPNNNVLGLNAEVKFGEQVLNYSLISKFNYENRNLDICEYIAAVKGRKFTKGNYKVNVFDNAQLVSSTDFALR